MSAPQETCTKPYHPLHNPEPANAIIDTLDTLPEPQSALYTTATMLASLILLYSATSLSSPLNPIAPILLLQRDLRAPGAKCASNLFSTAAVNAFEDNSAQFRICCPALTPEGIMLPEGPTCCVHITSKEYPEGCSSGAETATLLASVMGCEGEWKKKERNGIKYCRKGK